MWGAVKKGRWWIVGVALALPTAITWLYFVALRDSPASLQQGAYLFGKIIQFGLPVAWIGWTRREELRWSRPGTRGVAVGLTFGAVAGVAIWCLYRHALGPLGFFVGPDEQARAKVLGMGVDSPAKFIALGVFYSACHSGLEEYYWRWFVFRELRRRATLGWAIGISSLGFMTHHILVLAAYFGPTSPTTWLFSAAVAVGGAVWAWLYQRSESLLGPWVSHCLVDAAIFIVGFDLVRSAWK